MTKNQLLKILALKNIKVTPIPTEGTVLIFGATAADTEPVYYIGASGSTTHGILVNAGETLTIDWGDGTTSVSTATGLNAFAHQYSTTTNRVVTITSTGTIRFNGYDGGQLGYYAAVKSSIISLYLSTNVSINDYAFASCIALTSITIPNSVTSIGSYAFSRSTGLTSIIIPSSVTSIGRSAFDGCTGLTSVNIPTNITSIGEFAFASCTGLTSITFENSFIGNHMFSYCTGLTSVTIPTNITSIGAGAFGNLSGVMNLTSMTFMHTASDTLTLPTAGSDTGMLYVKTARNMTINHYGNAAVMNYAYATDNITATLVQK